MWSRDVLIISSALVLCIFFFWISQNSFFAAFIATFSAHESSYKIFFSQLISLSFCHTHTLDCAPVSRALHTRKSTWMSTYFFLIDLNGFTFQRGEQTDKTRRKKNSPCPLPHFCVCAFDERPIKTESEKMSQHSKTLQKIYIKVYLILFSQVIFGFFYISFIASRSRVFLYAHTTYTT